MRKKKPKQQRPRKVTTDMSKLPPAVVDGKLVARVKARVVFERTQQGQTRTHEGTIHSHDPATGYVSVYDETRGQFYGFELWAPPKIHVLNEDDIVVPNVDPTPSDERPSTEGKKNDDGT